jgi:hypothetical protein
MAGERRPPSDPADRALLALLFVAALAVAGWFLVRHIQERSRLQDCVMAGRRNCAPVEDDPGR